MVKKSTPSISTKVVETKIGTIPDLPEEPKPITIKPKSSSKPEIKILPSSNVTMISTTSKTITVCDSPSEKTPTSSPPAAKLSPLRARLKERTEKVPVEEVVKPLVKKQNDKKPRKKVVVDVKSPPKVFKSPTWYKSPSKKPVKEEDLVFKQLLLKDPKLTERDITKILADHK
jgi:hypothetical protein